MKNIPIIPLDDERRKHRRKMRNLRARLNQPRNRNLNQARNRDRDDQEIPSFFDDEVQMRWEAAKPNTVLETLETNPVIEALDGEAVVNKEQTETLKEENENTSLEILFIIDKSGSMSDKETVDSIIEGFNRVIKEQKAIPGKVTVSTILFNWWSTFLHNRVPLEDVKEMTSRDYLPTGGTALLDAVGTGINRIFTRQQETPENQRPEKTLVVIMTDGQENSSYQFKRSTVKRMITLLQEKRNWEFIYFGANVNHFAEAKDLGIDSDHAWAFETNEESIKEVMDECNEFACYCRMTPNHARIKHNPRIKR